MLSCILNSLNLALNAAITKAARHQNAVHAFHNLVHIHASILNLLSIHPFNPQLGFISHSCVTQGLGDADISILQSHIFANHSNSNLALILLQNTGYHVVPAAHILRLILQLQLTQCNGVQALLLHQLGHLINTLGSKVLDNSIGVHVAEHGHLFAHLLGDRLFAAAHDNIRRNTNAAQLLNAVLGGLSFELTSCRNVGHQGYMNVQNIVFAHFLLNLANSLEEGQAFDIANSTADFGNNNIGIILLANHKNSFLNRVSNMGNNLHRAAQIVTTTLLIDYTLVNLARGSIGVFGQVNIDKALIMTQIQVGFSAIISNKNLAMLIRAHRARVDIDIRVKFLDSYLVATTFQKTA